MPDPTDPATAARRPYLLDQLQADAAYFAALAARGLPPSDDDVLRLWHAQIRRASLAAQRDAAYAADLDAYPIGAANRLTMDSLRLRDATYDLAGYLAIPPGPLLAEALHPVSEAWQMFRSAARRASARPPAPAAVSDPVVPAVAAELPPYVLVDMHRDILKAITNAKGPLANHDEVAAATGMYEPDSRFREAMATLKRLRQIDKRDGCYVVVSPPEKT